MIGDKIQQSCYSHFSREHFLGDKTRMEHFLLWNTFYRRNIHRFVQDYLGLKIYWYQIIMLYMMNLCSLNCIIAARSAAKSFCIAIFACAKAILYPGSKIVVASSTLKQSRLIIAEKIKIELMGASPMLRREISNIKDSQYDSTVYFKNGSTIRVVSATENARGARSTIIIYEEARLIDKGIIDGVLAPFQIIRQVPYLKKEPYCNMDELKENPTDVFISSSWRASHWLISNTAKTALKEMINGKHSFVMAMDYTVAVKHNIKTIDFIRNQKQRTDSMSFAMEYENLAPAQSESAYFDFDLVNKNRVLQRAFYPRKNLDVMTNIKNKYNIPKQKGEIRVVTCDIAMLESDKNDNSIYTCLRLLPESHAVGQNIIQDYKIQLPYLECMHGAETSKQAVRIKELFYDFDADYCVLDVRNAGISVFDALAKVAYDDERCVEYPAWTAMNNDSIAQRCANTSALPIIFCIEGSLKLNNDIAVNLRSMFSEKKIDILVSQVSMAEEISKFEPKYACISDPQEKFFLEHPYLETSLLVDELINLQYEKLENTGLLRISEKGAARKDRYSSLSYGCYFASCLARDLLKKPEEINLNEVKLCVTAL